MFSPLIFASSPLVDFSLGLLVSCDWSCLAMLVRMRMSVREGATATVLAVLVCWLHTSSTELTVPVGPSVLAGADTTLLAVLVARGRGSLQTPRILNSIDP